MFNFLLSVYIFLGTHSFEKQFIQYDSKLKKKILQISGQNYTIFIKFYPLLSHIYLINIILYLNNNNKES